MVCRGCIHGNTTVTLEKDKKKQYIRSFIPVLGLLPIYFHPLLFYKRVSLSLPLVHPFLHWNLYSDIYDKINTHTLLHKHKTYNIEEKKLSRNKQKFRINQKWSFLKTDSFKVNQEGKCQ